jgi:hypothetical protein
MGYTHYWKTEKDFTPETWDKICTKVKKILDNSNVSLVGSMGETGTSPKINKDYISFNGEEEDSHESFVVTREKDEFNLCKTDRKPYDLPVCMCLLAIKEECPEFSF